MMKCVHCGETTDILDAHCERCNAMVCCDECPRARASRRKRLPPAYKADVKSRIGHAVKWARTHREMSQRDLATAIGSKRPTTITNIEAGRASVSIDMLVMIADATEMTLEGLFKVANL